MISRSQQILVKRAQREAGLDDVDYRDALAAAAGCRSTTDPKMTDRHVDLVMAYFEAVFWRRVDAGELQSPGKPGAVFQQRGFWAARNPKGNTTRDRFNGRSTASQATELEGRLSELGFGPGYMATIREKVTHGRSDERSLHVYCAALRRTLKAKEKTLGAEAPF